MSYKYGDDEEYKFVKELNKNRKISKKFTLYGAAVLGVMGLDYYFSNKVGIETLSKPLINMNANELVHTAIFGASSIATIGGAQFISYQI